MPETTSAGVKLQDLKLESCRYPLGGPWDRVEFFCGEPTVPGCSWCRVHRKRVFARLIDPKKRVPPGIVSETAPAARASVRARR
jgi:hypothetical protein